MISVLMPVYNTDPSDLEICLGSILQQSYNNFEIVIIDNGSTRNSTLKLLQEIKSFENIFVYRKEQQVGKKNISVALNYGLTKCKNELVARMDSDDIMLPNRLRLQQQAFLKNPNLDILGGQMYLASDKCNTVDELINNTPYFESPPREKIVDIDYIKREKENWFINHPTVMYKKSRILEIGGYLEEPDGIPEDFCLWVKAVANNFVVRNLQQYVLVYKVNNKDKLTNKDSEKIDWNNFCEEYKEQYLKNK